MWNPAFQQFVAQRRWRMEILGKAACPLMNLPMTNPQLHREYTGCEEWRGQILARLRAERPRLVVLGVSRRYGHGDSDHPGFTTYGPAWIDALTRLVQQLRGIGAQVLVLGPTPDPHTSVPICLSGHLDDATACSTSRSTAVDQPGIAAEAAATEAAGGQYADPTDLFCTTERCPVIVGNTLVYIDDNHMSAEYSRLLAPAIGALADRALAAG